jgi:hypothetical protein
MSQDHGPPDEPSEPDANRGLEDPRTIHPAPEGLFPEPGEAPAIESPASDPTSEDEGGTSDDSARGIVDPRNETIGPDI